MAKVKGPLFSLNASGTVAKAITFSKWKGVNAVKMKSDPMDPQTDSQKWTRFLFNAAVETWHSETEQTQSEWNALAKSAGLNMSGFNLYIQQYFWQGCMPADIPPEFGEFIQGQSNWNEKPGQGSTRPPVD